MLFRSVRYIVFKITNMNRHFITCEECVCVFNYFLYNYTDSFMRKLGAKSTNTGERDSLSINVNSVINSKYKQIKILKRKKNYGTFLFHLFLFCFNF